MQFDGAAESWFEENEAPMMNDDRTSYKAKNSEITMDSLGASHFIRQLVKNYRVAAHSGPAAPEPRSPKATENVMA